MPPKGRGRGNGQPARGQVQPPPGGQPGGGRGRGQPPPQQPGGHVAPAQQPKKPEKPFDLTELGLQLKAISPLAERLPTSPGPGKAGNKIGLITNNFEVDIPSGNIYHYDVEILNKKGETKTSEPKEKIGIPAKDKKKDDKKYRCMNTKINRLLFQEMMRLEIFRTVKAVYDGRKNMYTKKPLPFDNNKFTVQLPPEKGDPNPRNDDFDVVIKGVIKKETGNNAINLDSLKALFKGQVSSVNQDAIMALETVLRNTPCMRFVPVGRSFFYPPRKEDMHPLGGGREIWFGYHQSLRLGQWKPLINVDITATTFYEAKPLERYVADILRCSLDRVGDLRDADLKTLTKELRGLRIETTHLRGYRRKYRIFGFTRMPASRITFKTTVNGAEVQKTVQQYFAEQYNMRLKYPNLPCVHAEPRDKNIYLPIEVCDMIEGQHCKKKLEPRQTAEMIKFTAKSPEQRFKEIRGIMQDRANFAGDQCLNDFGIRVFNEPLKLEGRVLQAPSVRYTHRAEKVKIRPRDGQWELRGNEYFQAATIASWAVVSLADERFCGQQQLEKLAGLLTSIGREQGISIGKAAFVGAFNTRRQKVSAILREVKQKYNLTLAVVVISGRDKMVYGEVKVAAEQEVGMASQCVKDESVVKKCNPQLVSNLLQKINAKCGGINTSLTPGETPEIMNKPVIIMGADVTHPSPTENLKPSIAALVGSLDCHPSRYAVTCRAQTHLDENKKSVEIILDLKSMVVEMLKAFYKNTRGKKPEQIVFYRDGVSEGQFEHVRDQEVTAIREACASLGADYKPPLTYIVVQKRHHTRFMPQDLRQGAGRTKNIPPGTTVDTVVTHPLNFNFYLCSHFGLQGTSRPCHYTVIWDENNFTPDDLQKLSYYLCHTYARCTKSISAPVPVMYAHLAAYRARQHYMTAIGDSDSDHTGTGSSNEQRAAAVQAAVDAVQVLDTLKNTMYFV